MFRFLLKRLFVALPTLWIVSMLVFGLSQWAPGDPVEQRLSPDVEAAVTRAMSAQIYQQTARELGLDKPVFYVSLSARAFPDTLHRIVFRSQRLAAEKLIRQYGNWPLIQAFRATTEGAIATATTAKMASVENNLRQLLIQDDDARISAILNELSAQTDTITAVKNAVAAVNQAYIDVKTQPTRNLLFWPKLHFHGFDNQYHRWLMRCLSGDFGTSYRDGRQVAEKLSAPLSITLVMAFFTILLAYALAIPLGVFSVKNAGKASEKWLTRGLFALYATPNFWIATLALIFLTTPQYGLKIFPSAGMADVAVGATAGERLWTSLPRLILPVLCMIIHPVIVLTRQVSANLRAEMQQEYVKTALAKGLSRKAVLMKHALRNALFPLITILGQMIPLSIVGSFVVELVFNIPGMGRVAYEAIAERDWSVAFAIILLSSVVLLVGNLLADVLYRWVNPRVILN